MELEGALERIRTLEEELKTCRRDLELGQRAQSFFRHFHETTRDYGILLIDQENLIFDCNRAAEDVLGYRKQELVGSKGSIIFVPEDLARGVDATELGTAAQEGRAEDERWHRRKDGSRFWGSGVMMRMEDERGQHQGYCKIFRDLTTRKEMEDRLNASLREKELLLREIHHRVKNNLQVITALISMQRQAIANAEMQVIFDELQDRVRAIAALHESLYSSPDLGRILFNAYLGQLLEELYAFHGIDRRRIGLEIDADDIALDIEQALPLGLIVSELITNCFKHAFPENRKGTIRVRLKYQTEAHAADLDDGWCSLSVSDDGVGVPSERHESGSNSIGLHIIRLLAQELAGTLRLEPNEREGATFAIEFPLNRTTPAPETGRHLGRESSTTTS